MAELMVGNGQNVTAQNDADLYSGFVGSGSYVFATGNQMAASIVDNNTVRISDGIAIKEGRAFTIPVNSYDEFNIPNGTQGNVVYYYLGYHIYTADDGKEEIETVVTTNQTDVNSLRGGNTEMNIWLYKAKLNGLVLESVSALFDLVTPMMSYPTIRFGTADPDDSVGKDGDVYIKITG